MIFPIYRYLKTGHLDRTAGTRQLGQDGQRRKVGIVKRGQEREESKTRARQQGQDN
jgi:hypothetical protein